MGFLYVLLFLPLFSNMILLIHRLVSGGNGAMIAIDLTALITAVGVLLSALIALIGIAWVDRKKTNTIINDLQLKHTLSKAELYQQEITNSFKENSKEHQLSKERIEKVSTNIEKVSTNIDSTSTDIKLLKQNLDHHLLNFKSVEGKSYDLVLALKTFESYTQELGEKIREVDILKKKVIDLEYDKLSLQEKVQRLTYERSLLMEEYKKSTHKMNPKFKDRDDELEL